MLYIVLCTTHICTHDHPPTTWRRHIIVTYTHTHTLQLLCVNGHLHSKNGFNVGQIELVHKFIQMMPFIGVMIVTEYFQWP